MCVDGNKHSTNKVRDHSRVKVKDHQAYEAAWETCCQHQQGTLWQMHNTTTATKMLPATWRWLTLL